MLILKECMNAYIVQSIYKYNEIVYVTLKIYMTLKFNLQLIRAKVPQCVYFKQGVLKNKFIRPEKFVEHRTYKFKKCFMDLYL